MLTFILLVLVFIYIEKSAPFYKDNPEPTEEELDIANASCSYNPNDIW